jgi:hypothetical protein
MGCRGEGGEKMKKKNTNSRAQWGSRRGGRGTWGGQGKGKEQYELQSGLWFSRDPCLHFHCSRLCPQPSTHETNTSKCYSSALHKRQQVLFTESSGLGPRHSWGLGSSCTSQPQKPTRQNTHCSHIFRRAIPPFPADLSSLSFTPLLTALPAISFNKSSHHTREFILSCILCVSHEPCS